MKFLHRHSATAKPRVDFGVNRNGGLCNCGCNLPAPIAKTTARNLGIVKGEPLRFINGHHNLLPESYTVEDRGHDTPCYVFRNAKGKGYGYVHRGGKFIYVHRYFWERENGPLREGRQLHHECGVKNCVRLSHLTPLLVTDHQRIHPRAVLTMEKAREARRLVLVNGMRRKDVAELFGVSCGVIEAAVNGKTWSEA